MIVVGTGVGRLQHEARCARRHQGVGGVRLRGQGLRRLVVQPVDVVAEMDEAVAGRPAGEIGPGDRNLVGEPDVDALALLDAGIDLAASPARIVGEQPGREIAHLGHPRAAGGFEAVIVAEEVLVVGVVHVDRIGIRHVDAHGAERVPGAGILSQGEIGRTVGIPVDGPGIDLVALGVERTHVHAGEIARVLAHLGDDVLLGDGQRHRPGRIEIDGGDHGGERRRGPVGLADHHHVAPHHVVAFHRFGHGRGKVDHDIAFAERHIHRGQPIDRSGELMQALADRHIEGRERGGPDAAGFRQAVAALEMPDRRRHRVVEDIAADVVGRQILGHGQALAAAAPHRLRARRARAWRRSPAASANRRAPRAPNRSAWRQPCAARCLRPGSEPAKPRYERGWEGRARSARVAASAWRAGIGRLGERRAGERRRQQQGEPHHGRRAPQRLRARRLRNQGLGRSEPGLRACGSSPERARTRPGTRSVPKIQERLRRPIPMVSG